MTAGCRCPGAEIRRAREQRGLTLIRVTALMRRFGFAACTSTLSRYERGEVPVPVDEFMALSRITGLDPERAFAAATRVELSAPRSGGPDGARDGPIWQEPAGSILEDARAAVLEGDAELGRLLLETAPERNSEEGSLLVARVALACGDGPLALEHARRVRQRTRSPRATALWADAAIWCGGARAALDAVRDLTARWPGGPLAQRTERRVDGWLALDVGAEAAARSGLVPVARRFLRRALTQASDSADLRLLTWYRAHAVESRAGCGAGAERAATAIRRILALDEPRELGPVHFAHVLGLEGLTDNPTDWLRGSRLLSLFD